MPFESRSILSICTDPGIPPFGHKGCSTHVREMARALAEAGHRVRLAVSGEVGAVPADFPCEVIRLPAPRGRGWRWLGFDGRKIAGEWMAGRVLAAAVSRERPDFIYERYSLYGRVGERLARRLGVPRVVEVNAFMSEEAAGRLRFPGWARRVELGVLGRAPALAAISLVMRERLIEATDAPPERVFVSPMGFDPARFHPGVGGAEPWRELGLEASDPARPFLIGYVGSFNRYHRPEWLLDLAEGLRARGRKVLIAVIGGASRKVEEHRAEAGRRGIESDFRYLGGMDHERLPVWMKAFDVAVVPGAAPQSSPTKIVEAAAVGTVQVVPDQPPVRWLLDGLGDWAFFDPESCASFVARADAVLADLARCRGEAMALAGRAPERHGWGRRAAEVVESLERQRRAASSGVEKKRPARDLTGV